MHTFSNVEVGLVTYKKLKSDTMFFDRVECK
jgi:hypothetical protein